MTNVFFVRVVFLCLSLGLAPQPRNIVVLSSVLPLYCSTVAPACRWPVPSRLRYRCWPAGTPRVPRLPRSLWTLAYSAPVRLYRNGRSPLVTSRPYQRFRGGSSTRASWSCLSGSPCGFVAGPYGLQGPPGPVHAGSLALLGARPVSSPSLRGLLSLRLLRVSRHGSAGCHNSAAPPLTTPRLTGCYAHTLEVSCGPPHT